MLQRTTTIYYPYHKETVVLKLSFFITFYGCLIDDAFLIVNDTELAFDEIIEVMNDYYGPVARELFGIPKFKEIKYTLLIYLWITIANDCFTKFLF